ncbi:unnamed protein product [Chironomus riparius]|uniref:Uncharacterized protein n=1 Tax=Chironomus riparius TaxID=315576 RepID=A0A9N9RU78_9DIPT|nr:unnamed protein product [Chironomus riparius]
MLASEYFFTDSEPRKKNIRLSYILNDNHTYIVNDLKSC